MNLLEAHKFVKTLYRTGRIKITTRIEKEKNDARVVFSGGLTGDHSIWLSVSSQERILAHFEGYCEANGMDAPKVGQLVRFPSPSNWQAGGTRLGRVVKVGPKRAVVAYKFKHGGQGAPRAIPIADLVFEPARRVQLVLEPLTRFERV